MSSKVLRYRYTLEELKGMLKALQDRSRAYQGWLKHVEALLDGEHVEKPGQWLHVLCFELLRITIRLLSDYYQI